MPTPVTTSNSDTVWEYGQKTYDQLLSNYDPKVEYPAENSFSAIIDNSLRSIRENTNSNIIIDAEARKSALAIAYQKFEETRDSILSANKSYEQSGQSGIDPSLIFIPYASGYEKFIAACPGGGDNLEGCEALREKQTGLEDLINSSFDPARTREGDATIYVRANGSKDSIKEVPEVPNLKTDYQMMQVVGGIQFALGNDKSPNILEHSGPLLETDISLVSGSQNNGGSHRTEIDLRGGWRQNLFSFNLPNKGQFDFATTISTGLGAAFNQLSFGNGYIDPHEHSLMSSSQIYLDAGYCWPNSKVCTDISGGYFYERTLLGLPDYHNDGFFFGLTYTNDINWR